MQAHQHVRSMPPRERQYRYGRHLEHHTVHVHGLKLDARVVFGDLLAASQEQAIRQLPAHTQRGM